MAGRHGSRGLQNCRQVAGPDDPGQGNLIKYSTVRGVADKEVCIFLALGVGTVYVLAAPRGNSGARTVNTFLLALFAFALE